MNEKFELFSKDNWNVRTMNLDGEPWFVGKDVADALGYKNTKDAILRYVDDEDKQVLLRSRFTTLENHIPKAVFPVSFVDADIPNRGLTVINESGIYSLVFSSKLPEAKSFKHWVTSEILPTIRKHGAYMTDETLKRALTEPEFLRDLADQLIEEKNKRLALEAEKTVMLPKADYYDKYMESPDLINTGVIAQNYGMSAARFNKMLERMGIQYRSGAMWILKKEYIDKGYMQSATYQREDGEIRNWNKWTPSGQKFLYDFLKEHEIIPVAERQTKRWQTNVI